jgi:hypothetical protein
MTAKARGVRAAILAAAIAVAALSLSVAPAMGAYDHSTVETKFPVENECLNVGDIAVLEPEGLIYATCRLGQYPNEADQIMRFHLDGTPAPFSANAQYISGNRLIADPGSEDGTFASLPDIAVDSSSSPNHGKLFVTSAPNVDIFNPSGLHAGAIPQPIETTIPNNIYGVEVGPDGSIYVTSGMPQPGRVSKYNTSLNEVRRAYPSSPLFFGGYARMAIDNNGAFWYNPGELRKYEADQFTEELKPKFGTPVPERFFAVPSPYAADPVIGGGGIFGGNVFGIDVDLNTNDLFANRGEEIEVYSEGTPSEHSFRDVPSFGQGVLHESTALAATKSRRVVVSNEGATGPEIIIFGPGNIVPDVKTAETNILDVGHTGATLHATIERDTGANVTGCTLEYVQTNNPRPPAYPESVPCSPDPASSPPGSNFSAESTDVSATLSGLTSGLTYHYRFSAENEHGKNVGIDRIVVPAFVLQLLTLPASNVSTHAATFNASLDPDGKETTYYFQYGLTTDYGLETAVEDAGSGSGTTSIATPVTSLPSGHTFHYRVVATNEDGTTIGPDQTVRTASPPDIASVRASDMTGNSAVLHASINPVGYDSEYFFEYGTSTGYGEVIPVEPEDLGSGTNPVSITQTVTNLQPGSTYHFRVVAKNEWGTTESADTTFDFSPPTCPNNHVRQETGASYLPDCRAYELVSMSSSGSVILFPGQHIAEESSEFGGGGPYHVGFEIPPNQGFATAPSRFAFFGGLSSPPGLNSPVGLKDMYMSTRTNSGWVSSVPGLQGEEAFQTGRKECAGTMDLCIDHSETNEGNFHEEFAPYVFTAGGEKKGRLPTNVGLIPEGKFFKGNQVMSRDFNHFVFSSNSFAGSFGGGATHPAIVFAPGGQTDGIGSAYDNNIRTREVNVISKLPGGEPIPTQAARTADEKGIDFRGVSTDGSHILMETPAEPPQSELAYLFLRVNDAFTFDITEGHPAIPIGMTQSGNKVFFTTADALVPADTDSSVDLYQWREKGPEEGELTVLSQGNGQGNSDECSDGWGPSGCGVEFLRPELPHPDQGKFVSARGMDDLFAEDSGDIYFYSPENLDGTHPGVRNERNLYVYRNGAVQLVATMDRGTQVTRMQIAPNGSHAAIRTKSALTSYDTKGFQEIYTYNADTGLIRCASCDPTGAAPTADAEASQNGRFMADDGRTFFASKDRLDPRDRDGSITDIYEYVDGRPQLITTGQGNQDFTGGSEVFNLLSISAYIGLESVSHSGVDVYFSTFETLVKRDHNGEYVKFYDARTGGGFPEEPELLPCEAADECHGADSSPPPPPSINSAGALGGSGNIQTAPQRKAKGRAHKKHRRHRSRKRHHKRHQGTHRNARHSNG